MLKLYIAFFDINEKLQERKHAHSLAKYAVHSLLGIPYNMQRHAKTKSGKPYLENDLSFHYNISHTDGCAVCAVADCAVGVDVELLREPNEKIVRRFFAKGEQQLYDNAADKPRAFYKLWTQKEAYVKCSGTGFTYAINSFDVTAAEIKPTLLTLYTNGYTISICKGTIWRAR